MSEYPWYSELVMTYWPEIETLIPSDEKVMFQFIGVFEGLGSRVSGLCVLTDQKMYIRGKAKAGAWTPVWKLAGAKKVQVYPYDAMYEMIEKGAVKVIFRLKLDYMGEKYIGKTGKVLMAPHQGKEKGLGKEPKEEWIKRVADYKAFIMSKISK